jgi:N,N'-diacetyllegionaminate synthase
MRKVKLGDRVIGDGHPTFIIAEAGINHNGDINLAKKLIDVAKEARVDAVKFQTFRADELVSRKSLKAKHIEGEASFFEMVKRLELGREDFKKIAEYARRRDIIFLSTPLGEDSVDMLYDLGVPAYKIASGDITNIPLLKYIAQKKLPVILSTGMSTLGEIEEALDTIYSAGNEEVVLLHCVASYPTPLEEVNLRVMETLRQAFQVPVGFSDHTTSTIVPVAAVASGASVIEKHFTLDKNLAGPDHKASASPDELKLIVEGIREAEMVSGSPVKKPTKSEEETKAAFRRSIVAKVDIPKGTKITREMLATKRPGTGIPPKFIGLVMSRNAVKDISSDELINWEDV